MWQIWLIAAGVFFVVEIATVGFMIFWLGIAALVTCLLSLVISNVFAQMAIFVILSAIFLVFTRPFVEKFVIKKDEKVITNAYSIIGKEAIVTKSFDNVSGVGQIKVGSEKWTAITENNTTFNEGDKVIVSSIDGVKAIVAKI